MLTKLTYIMFLDNSARNKAEYGIRADFFADIPIARI